LRDYGCAGQIGLEATPEAFVARMVEVFEQVRRVLKPDGTLWMNLGDSYAAAAGQASRGGPPSSSSTLEGNGHRGGGPKLAELQRVRLGKDCDPKLGPASPGQPYRHGSKGLKPKDLVGMPWRVAFALQAAGWWLRSDIIWHKPNPMPESVTDRPTKAHEYLFLFTKSGEPTFWQHRDGQEVRKQPRPDYRWIDHVTEAELDAPPENWKSEMIVCPQCLGAGVVMVAAETDLFGSMYPTPVDCAQCQGETGQEVHRYERVNLWTARDYYYDAEAIAEPVAEVTLNDRVDTGRFRPDRGFPGAASAGNGRLGDKDTRNKRTVWTVPTAPYKEAHFATFPPDLIKPCILAGTRPGDVVLDPFGGSGTTGQVALELGRRAVLIELNPEYVKLIEQRTSTTRGLGL
jgi:site-specific DNA-methyltransferase (adenine-specific)